MTGYEPPPPLPPDSEPNPPEGLTVTGQALFDSLKMRLDAYERWDRLPTKGVLKFKFWGDE